MQLVTPKSEDKTSIRHILSIGGLDSRSGGGITSDYSVFRSLNTFPFVVQTSIVSVFDSEIDIKEFSTDVLIKQLNSIEHISFAAIKIGFLPNASFIDVVYDFIERKISQNPRSAPKIVLDPVIAFKEEEQTHSDVVTRNDDYLDHLVKLMNICDIITPNNAEWEIISGQIQNTDNSGNLTIIVKDIAPESDVSIDRIYYNYLADPENFDDITLPRINTQNVYGAGCTFSAIITALIGAYPLKEVIEIAKGKTHYAISQGIEINKDDNLPGGPVGRII